MAQVFKRGRKPGEPKIQPKVVKRVPRQNTGPTSLAELEDYKKHRCSKPGKCANPQRMPLASDDVYDYHWCDTCYRLAARRKYARVEDS